jgi:tyrosinase
MSMTLTSVALYPFHRNAAGDFWTLATVCNHTVFGSTYPEFLNLSATNTLVGRVNALYGGNVTSRFSCEITRTNQYIVSPQSGDVQHQYCANIHVRHKGPGGPSKVFKFLGTSKEINEKSPDTQKWISEPGFVGSAGFQNANGDKKKDLTSDMKIQANGVVALMVALEDQM